MTTKHNRERYQELLELMQEYGKLSPKTMGTYNRLHRVTTDDGALPYKTKELMAFAIAVALRCDACIAYHINASLEAGASDEEIVEAIGVAILMSGGPGVMYGVDALGALEEIKALRAEGAASNTAEA